MRPPPNLYHSQSNSLGPEVSSAVRSGDGSKVTVTIAFNTGRTWPRGNTAPGLSVGPHPFGFSLRDPSTGDLLDITHAVQTGDFTFDLYGADTIPSASIIQYPTANATEYREGEIIRNGVDDRATGAKGLPLRSYRAAIT